MRRLVTMIDRIPATSSVKHQILLVRKVHDRKDEYGNVSLK